MGENGADAQELTTGASREGDHKRVRKRPVN